MFRIRQSNKPCRHMEGLIQRSASGQIRGFAKLYLLAHVARCGPCRKFLESLEEMLLRLKAAEHDDRDVIERLESFVHRLAQEDATPRESES